MNKKYYLKFGDKLTEVTNPKMNDDKRKFINKSSKQFDAAASKVIKTVFHINDIHNNDSEEVYESLKGKILLSKFGKIKREAYHTSNDNLWAYYLDLKPAQILLLTYISCTLWYNSNVYVADYDKISNDLGISKVQVQNTFTDLINIPNNIVLKTNVPKVYLINHNVFFKGNYDEFAQIYKELYDDETATLDEKGRVIIK